MEINNSNQIVAKFKDLIKRTTEKTEIIKDIYFSILEEIPELISFINEDNDNIKKSILKELSQNMEIIEYTSGNYLRKVLGMNDDFYMILSGKILELEIKYIKTNMSFKEYILYLTRLYLLKEENLYKDCLERNNEIFPISVFYNYKNYTSKKENEKNCFDEKDKDNNINIISLCKDIEIKDFNYKEELKKIKNNIKNSAWNKRRNLLQGDSIDYSSIINSFLELYNINQNINVNFSINETRYSVYIPFFINKNILEPVSFIGTLNYPHIMKNFKGYICLTDSFVIYLDKKISTNNHFIYNHSNRKKCENTMNKLFKNHYIFKNMNTDFLNRTFGKYFEMMILKKNDILFKQNEPHKGVYIITKGVIQLKTNRTYNELNDLNFILLHSLDNFPFYVTDIKTIQIKNKKKLEGYYNYDSETNSIMKNPIFSEKAKEKNDIIFCQYGINDILGLGEVYDSKTKINLFTAKCISDEAEIFFLPNEIFNGLLSDDDIYRKCGIIIEEKANIFIKCIAKYRYIFEKRIEYIINSYKNVKKFNRMSLSGKNKSFKNYKYIMNTIKNETNNKLKYNVSYNFKTVNGKKIKIKLSTEENDKQNNLNFLQKSKEDINTNIKLNDLIKQNFEDNQDYINYKEDENTKLIMPNISSDNNIFNKNLVPSSSIVINEKNLTLNESYKNKKNNQLFSGNKIIKNQKHQIIKSSSSLVNDNSGIKKRMKEMSNYYSRKNSKRYSEPIIISYMDNAFLNKKNNNNIHLSEEENRLKSKINKGIGLGRCLSAKIYKENNFKTKFNVNNNSIKSTEYSKKYEDINKFYNVRPFSCQKEKVILNKMNSKYNNNPKKMTINKFLASSLFPLANVSNDQIN